MGRRWDTGRTEAFSDGVFAIAITLLVLDINVPESAYDDLWGGIGDQWPSYLAYVTSFAKIGAVWMAHHGMFGRLRSVDGVLVRLNLLLLLVVSFLPFPTRLAADAIERAGAERAALVLYGVTLLLIAVVLAAMWRWIAAHPELCRTDVPAEDIASQVRASTPDVGSYAAAIGLALIAPRAAAAAFLVIAVLQILRAPGDRPAAPAITG